MAKRASRKVEPQAPEPPTPAAAKGRRPRRTPQELDALIPPGSLADRVLKLMRDRGLSAKALSLRAGLSSDGVRSILRGRVDSPRGQSLVQLAAAFGLSVDELTGGTIRVPESVRAAVAASGEVQEVYVHEYDLRPRYGGTLNPAVTDNPRRRTWRMPSDMFEERGLSPLGLAIVRVAGTAHGIGPLDRILVEIGGRRMTGGSLVLVHQGDLHIVARLPSSFLPHRGNVTFNNSEGGSHDLADVQATVVGRWTWE